MTVFMEDARWWGAMSVGAFARVNSAPENGVIRKVALLVNRIAEALLAGFFLHIAHVGLLLLQLSFELLRG